MANKYLRVSLLFFFTLLFQSPAFSQEAEITAIERKKLDQSIRWGEAEATSLEIAKANAEKDLARKFKKAMGVSSSMELANNASGSGVENYSSELSSTMMTTIENMREISYSTVKKNKETKREEKWYTVFVYITEADYQKAQENRRMEERELIQNAISQEENLCLAAALKYYNWALTAIKAYNDTDLDINIKGEKKNAKLWLEAKLESILSNLRFEVDKNSVMEHESGIDKYSVVVNAFYDNNPVSTLDVKYFNLEDYQETRAKSGKMTFLYPEIDNLKNLTFNIQYRYSDDAKIAGGIIEAIYKQPSLAALAIDLDGIAIVNLPFKYNAKKGEAKNSSISTASGASMASEVKPMIKPGRTPMDKSEYEAVAPSDLIAAMTAVENAIKQKNFESVRNLFTPEGYHIFSLLTSKSKIRIVGKPEYTVEETSLFTIGKSIPISVSKPGHTTTENLVFRFDKESKKIKSVAFSLTKRAEDDIFRNGADWQIDSRYSIMTFMEDYQTAFYTQDLEYISKIFSNNAIIITGKFSNDEKGIFQDDVIAQRGGKRGKYVVYKTQTKDQYLKNLSNCFKQNAWTHIDFEENVISKINTDGLIDNDVMWIEIKQNWKSSKYCDVGYLALQINLVPGGSKINVRTWTPDFVDIDELKNRFPVNL